MNVSKKIQKYELYSTIEHALNMMLKMLYFIIIINSYCDLLKWSQTYLLGLKSSSREAPGTQRLKVDCPLYGKQQQLDVYLSGASRHHG